MAEREILRTYDLPWSSDPHNSLIVSMLGVGLPGVFLYLMGIGAAPLSYLKNAIKKENSEYGFFLTVHIMLVCYGITSSSFIAVPTFLLIVYIAYARLIELRFNAGSPRYI
jgi:O-antigen ligase